MSSVRATCAYWRSEGLTPADCLEAMGCLRPREATWGEVEVVAAMRERCLLAASEEREQRRRAVVGRAVREPGGDALERELWPAAMRVAA